MLFIQGQEVLPTILLQKLFLSFFRHLLQKIQYATNYNCVAKSLSFGAGLVIYSKIFTPHFT